MATRFPNIPTPASAPAHVAAQVQVKLQQGLALHQRGLLAEAQTIYLDLLKSQPRNFDLLNLLGVIASQTGDHRRAIDYFNKAIEIFPGSAACYNNRGNALQEFKRYDAAVASFDKAIAITPDYAEAHFNRGNALQELKRFDAAVASYDRAIAFKSNYAQAYYNRGNALKQLNRFDAAIASYDQAIAVRPDHAMAYGNRGNALVALKQFDAAVVSYDGAVAIKPDYAEAYYNRGNALQELGQFAAAVASYDKAISIKPDYAEAYCNRGNALKELNQLDAAVASHDKAIAIKPEYVEAYWNNSIALLLKGDFDRGLEFYEWRWKGNLRNSRRNFQQRLWLGREPLKGKTILLHSEQGLGDTIQFCRYAKLVTGLGARVLLEVPSVLLGLLKGLEGVAEIVEKGAPLPDFDFHCPLLSLPLALGTKPHNIPRVQSYLRSDVEKVAIWAGRLGTKNKPRVGLVWSGRAGYKVDQSRSITLSQLLPYLPRNAGEFFSLQKELRDADRVTLQAESDIRHCGDQLDDFADTAALCELMDLVISVDTSVAHLAGALGKKTWIMLPFSPDWRWLLERADSDWYPSVRLYRQSSIGDWASVFEKVCTDLLGM